MKNPHILSKSSFLRGCQCPKSLYLYKNHKKLGIERDPMDDSTQSVFQTGTDVGILARDLFPGGIDASPENYYEFDQSLQKTIDLIEQGETIIYEAAFEHKGVVAAVDILVKSRGRWKAYEVKSTTSVKEVHTLDAAIQYWVIKGCRLDLQDIAIVHLDNKYVRNGGLDIHQLFRIVSVKSQVLEMQPDISKQVNKLKGVLKQRTVPKVDIGPHCADPYDCDFRGHCWKHIPDKSVFEIARLRQDRKFELYYQGIVSLRDVPTDYRMSEKQWMQVRGYLEKLDNIDPKAVKKFLSTLSYPLHFADFETFMPAVPMFSRSRAYQQLPFQFSVHYLETAGGKVKHSGFLSKAGGDPRPEFLKAFLEQTEGTGSIVVYNASFENGRMKELAKDFPGYRKPLAQRMRRVRDLIIPFRGGSYYKPKMNGSYSIKAVLPALVPELSYKNLDIQEGGSASSAFFNLFRESDKKIINETRQQLLDYCKMDTLAMVKILEVLNWL